MFSWLLFLDKSAILIIIKHNSRTSKPNYPSNGLSGLQIENLLFCSPILLSVLAITTKAKYFH